MQIFPTSMNRVLIFSGRVSICSSPCGERMTAVRISHQKAFLFFFCQRVFFMRCCVKKLNCSQSFEPGVEGPPVFGVLIPLVNR